MAKTALTFDRINNAWTILTDSGEIVTGVEKVDFHIDSYPGNDCGCIDVRFKIDAATMKTVET